MRYISQRWDIDLFARVVQIALYIVMEYVPGGSLTQKLKEPFSTAAAAFYSAQIALALIHLHDMGVLYRYCASLALFPRCILHHGFVGEIFIWSIIFTMGFLLHYTDILCEFSCGA